MKTNFFETIAGLNVSGDLKINIHTDTSGKMAVSVLLTNEALADNTGKRIPPMLLKGDATELDEGFFNAISVPVQQTAQLFANMDAYQKELDKAKAASKQETDKKAKKDKQKPDATGSGEQDDEAVFDELEQAKSLEKQQKEEKKKAYEEAMKKIAELNTDCKYEEAINIMPSVADYPDKEAEITKKTAELHKRKVVYDTLKLEL
jgi:PRTRC genetic system protein E